MTSTKNNDNLPFSQIVKNAGNRALGGGLPGAAAMGVQVASLMWLRTTMNYQYRHGTNTVTALRTLYAQGGIPRFYKGVGWALIQGPMSRFGDTAANAGVLSFLNATPSTRDLPVAVKTVCASVAAGLFRIVLTPVDTCKTIMQVEGKDGLRILGAKIKKSGPKVMFYGALASAGATMAGHFPWFFTHNYLNENLPLATTLGTKLLRNATIGFCSSVISDTVSNSIRVIKTTKQTHTEAISYPQAVRLVVQADGVIGLFGRGLRTRIMTNALQSILFTIVWKALEEQYHKRITNKN